MKIHTVAFKRTQRHLGVPCSTLQWTLENGIFVYYRRSRAVYQVPYTPA